MAVMCIALLLVATWAARDDPSPHELIASETARAEERDTALEVATSSEAGARSGSGSSSQDLNEHDENASVCRLIVVDNNDTPITGAYISESASYVLLGQTDQNGKHEVLSSSASGLCVIVRADQFVSRVVRIPSPAPENLRIRLREGWQISGRVQDPRGNMVGAGVRVVALHPNDELSLQRFKASLRGHGPIPATTTDVGGEFLIKGLDPAVAYRLYAGGQGFCAADPFGDRIHTGNRDTQYVLTVFPVYGLRVSIQEPEGTRPRIGETLGGRWWGTPTGLAEDARIVMSGPWTADLLGIDQDLEDSPFERLNFFLTHSVHGDSIDASLELDFPGYAPTTARLRADRVMGPLERQIVTIEPDGPGFGSLTVWLEPVEQIARIIPFETDAAQPTLLLDASTGSSPQIRVKLPDLHDGFYRVEGIPHGTYFARFKAPHQLFMHPAHDVNPGVVTVDERHADFRVPLTDVGSLHIRIVDSEGCEYVGPITGEHQRVVGKETNAFYFRAQPYGIPFLPYGDYTIHVRVDGRELLSPFSIVDNEVTEVELHIP